MNRNRMVTKWTALSLVLSATLATGCEPLNWFGTNLTITNIVPVGLGGSPGLLNPFGIVQAFVNSLLGIGTTTTTETSDSGSGGAGSPVPNAGTISTVVTQ